MSARPLRLLHVLSTSELGGTERAVLNFIRYSDPAKIESSLLALLGTGPVPQWATDAGANHAEGWKLESTSQPRLIGRLRRRLIEGNFDIVHSYGLRADLLTRLAARGLPVKVVNGIRSIDPWRRWYHVLTDRLTAGRVDLFISNSEAGKRARMQREGTRAEKIVVVPTGIPDRAVADAATKAAARQRFEIGPDDGPVIAVVANIRKAKGHEDLIEAVKLLAEKWPKLICICAGRDDSGFRIPNLAEMHDVGRHFIWTGFLEDPGPVYDAADLFVLPSHWEGLPQSVIEAMRAGLPIVATDVGGVREIVEDGKTGLLITARTPEELNAAMDCTLGDYETAQRYAAAGREEFEKSFQLQTSISQYESCLINLGIQEGRP